jgi:hypothetical protein
MPDLSLRTAEVIGSDPIPYGVAANRRTLEAFMKFNVQQGSFRAPCNWRKYFLPA